ncbi:MAG: hypothetical protein COW59_03265 [Lysobacterales bacterium CG17_big_fil_post_rev_8_21_14_2_50_64_11]|nr:MAG: hypothetical protein COW59_03265 [Xanthomonadales bacterium CG17_big_fil_post_rev_8_21_14_2_50_64_11]PIX60692.1 MAG: hypothetical protein COZ47_05815 [Xanthomonadales bacterium CG_4_10_14_3_um_filter_64_11]
MPCTQAPSIIGLATAAGIGLLIGLVRERAHAEQTQPIAGLRTHALAALAGAIAFWMGTAVLVVLLAGLVVMTALGYQRSRQNDPGLTGEVTLLLTPLLGALAMQAAPLAAGLGVASAVLLQAKASLHRFSRVLLSEQEVHDGLVLLASALVVLPLLPSAAVDPWGVLRPAAVWRLVVLVMGVGVLGHIAQRAAGARWGLPLAGFFAGFVSSTAVVAGYGATVRQRPELAAYAASAALLSNLASLLLMVAVVAVVSPALLAASALPLAAAGAALLVSAGIGLRATGVAAGEPPPLSSHSFQVRYAVGLALAISMVLLISAVLTRALGNTGALIATSIAALAEWHAAAASLAQLAAADALPLATARCGLLLLLVASAVAKTALAFVLGDRGYGVRVAAGLWGMVAAAAIVAAV